MDNLESSLLSWFWTLRYETAEAMATLRDQLIMLIGEHRGDAFTAMALLGFVAAVAVTIFMIVSTIGIMTGHTQTIRYCPHGRPLGPRTKNFCAQCAEEKHATEEIHARLRSRRLYNEDV